MSEPDLSDVPPPIEAPPPVNRRWRGPSLVWLVPIVALAVGVTLIVRSLLATGPSVTIEFETAEGLRPGQTEVRYKEVVVGRVEEVALSEDRQRVHAAVRLSRSAAALAVEDTRFWIVKPRIDIGGVSGLETLVSGAYIGVDAGVSEEEENFFKGLPTAPYVLRGEPGRDDHVAAGRLPAVGRRVPCQHLTLGRGCAAGADPARAVPDQRRVRHRSGRQQRTAPCRQSRRVRALPQQVGTTYLQPARSAV